MKLVTILSVSALSTVVAAWAVQFHTRSNVGINAHGTLPASCNTIGWGTGRAQEDVNWIK